MALQLRPGHSEFQPRQARVTPCLQTKTSIEGTRIEGGGTTNLLRFKVLKSSWSLYKGLAMEYKSEGCTCVSHHVLQSHVLQLQHVHTVPAPSRQRQDKLKFEVSLGCIDRQQHYQNTVLHVWKHIVRNSSYLYWFANGVTAMSTVINNWDLLL